MAEAFAQASGEPEAFGSGSFVEFSIPGPDEKILHYFGVVIKTERWLRSTSADVLVIGARNSTLSVPVRDLRQCSAQHAAFVHEHLDALAKDERVDPGERMRVKLLLAKARTAS